MQKSLFEVFFHEANEFKKKKKQYTSQNFCDNIILIYTPPISEFVHNEQKKVITSEDL